MFYVKLEFAVMTRLVSFTLHYHSLLPTMPTFFCTLGNCMDLNFITDKLFEYVCATSV